MQAMFSELACCARGQSVSDTQAREKNNAIDRQLKIDAKRLREEIKLLLLGPGESGKSTIFKQMKIISLHGGFTQEERENWTLVVYNNIITQMKVLIGAANKLRFELSSDAAREAAGRILDLPTEGEAWSKQVGADIEVLWADEGIRKTYEERDKQFQLNDSAAYFFDEIKRIAEDGYLPVQNDVLRARVRSTGIEEAQFKFDNMEFKMLDVGGQRSERRKWIHCFEGVTAVLFCASLSEYDQCLREDPNQNRMKESLLLFDEICNSPWFKTTPFILLLNKVDLFKEKIDRVPLKTTFPNYTGGSNLEKGQEFIRERYLEMNSQPKNHTIFPHFTCAVNTENIQFVFRCVRETILERVLETMF